MSFSRNLKLLFLLFFISGTFFAPTAFSQNEIKKKYEPSPSTPVQNPFVPELDSPLEPPPQFDRPHFPETPITRELIERRDSVLRNIEQNQISPPVRSDQLNLEFRVSQIANKADWVNFQRELKSPDHFPETTNEEFIKLQQDINQKDLERFDREFDRSQGLQSYELRAAAAVGGYAFNEVSRQAVSAEDRAAALQSLKIATQLISFALDLTPGIGNVKGILEATIGYDITGAKLSTTERVIAGVTALPFGFLFKGARAALKFNIIGASKVLNNTDSGRIVSNFVEPETAAKIIEGAGRNADEFSREFSKLADKLDDPALDKIGAEKLSDLQAKFLSKEGRLDLRQGGKRLATVIGDDSTARMISNADPLVALKAVQDLGAAERVTGSLMNAGNATRLFDEAVEFNSRLLSGETIEVAMKIPNPSTFEAALRGNKLTTNWTRQRPYTNELFNPAVRSSAVQELPRSTYFEIGGPTREISRSLPAATDGLESVTPILRGSLDSSKVMPSKFRATFSKGTEGAIRVVGELSDEAYEFIEYQGRQNVDFISADGTALALGKNGNRFISDLPAPANWSSEAKDAYVKEFVDGTSGIVRNTLEPGQILVRSHGGSSGATGRWFSLRRFETVEEAEAATNVLKYGNDSKNMDLFIVTDRTSVYSGLNSGSKTLGSEIQIFVPNKRILTEAVEIKDVMKRIDF